MKFRRRPSTLIKVWSKARLSPLIGGGQFTASGVHFASTVTQSGPTGAIVQGDLAGDQHLMLVAFDAYGVRAFDSWMPLALRLSQLHRTFFHSRLLAADARTSGRWFTRKRTARHPWSLDQIKRLSQSREEIASVLGIPTDLSICAVLVDSGGNVVWKECGALTVTKAAALVDAVNRPLSRDVP